MYSNYICTRYRCYTKYEKRLRHDQFTDPISNGLSRGQVWSSNGTSTELKPPN